MRITASSFPETLVNQLDRLSSRQNRLQNQAATGQRIQFPSDDPGAVRRVLDMQSELSTAAQYQSNIAREKDLAAASFASMKALKQVTDRAGEIATLADGVKSKDQLQTYAKEIAELISHAVQIANAKHQGDFLFAGTQTDKPPFQATYDADGNITGVTYAGNQTVAATEISEAVTVSNHVIGSNTTGTGPTGLLADSRNGTDLFAHLISLHQHLQAGDSAAIAATDRDALTKDESGLVNHMSENGTVQARLETSAAWIKSRVTSLKGLVSKESDADLAETLVRLNETQTAYKAALQSGAQVLNQSLLDFLR